MPFGQHAPHERADDQCAEEVEEEARVGFESEDTGSDTEEGGGEGADRGEHLWEGWGSVST